jgi:hypothetical protein
LTVLLVNIRWLQHSIQITTTGPIFQAMGVLPAPGGLPYPGPIAILARLWHGSGTIYEKENVMNGAASRAVRIDGPVGQGTEPADQADRRIDDPRVQLEILQEVRSFADHASENDVAAEEKLSAIEVALSSEVTASEHLATEWTEALGKIMTDDPKASQHLFDEFATWMRDRKRSRVVASGKEGPTV